MEVPDTLRYTEEHEWTKVEDGHVRVGITHYAQDQLGDVVYVELPAPGDRVRANEVFGVVESVKAASDLFSPVTGEVTAVNEALAEAPELVNDDPYGEGWMLVVAVDDPGAVDGLLDAAAYSKLVAEAD